MAEDRSLSTSQTIQFGAEADCSGLYLRVEKAEAVNQYAIVYPPSIGMEPSVKVTAGTLRKVTPESKQRERLEISQFGPESQLPSGVLVHIEVANGDTLSYYGVKEETVYEQYVIYEYFNEEARVLCRKRETLCDEEVYEEGEEESPGEVLFAYMVVPPDGADRLEPCVLVADSTVTYDCTGTDSTPECEDQISISIGSSERPNVFSVEYSAGYPAPTILCNIPFTRIYETEKFESETIQSFTRECALPEDGEVLSSMEVDGLYYGFVKRVETRMRRSYELTANSPLPAEVPVYAYIVEGPCYATASTVLTFQPPRPPDFEPHSCWIELESENNELVYMSWGSEGGFSMSTPSIRAINGEVYYRGLEETPYERLVEFTDLASAPDDAVYAFRQWSPTSRRYVWHGVRLLTGVSVRHAYEVRNTSTNAESPVFVYAYSNTSSCPAFDQLILQPTYTEEQKEEYEVYKVASRIIMTQDGVYSCPGPDLDDEIRVAFGILKENAQGELVETGVSEEATYLISEITHEQGFISQFWYRDYARPERHEHEHKQIHPKLTQLMPGGFNPDYYIKWTPPNAITEANSSVKPGGRNLYDVYRSLRHVGKIPFGVSRRWAGVRQIVPTFDPFAEGSNDTPVNSTPPSPVYRWIDGDGNYQAGDWSSTPDGFESDQW